jgi:protein-L-isoaspartate(D-aspartate) O-methyltransferase
MQSSWKATKIVYQRARDRLIDRLREQGIRNEKVLEAMRQVPRHRFIDEALSSHAYENSALPIGQSQTISQPYIVARMTEMALSAGMPAKVLEIGTGCGYQTAVLALLVKQVYTVERLQSLQQQARKRLQELDLRNVFYRYGDGHLGWEEHAPYQAILVTAAPETVPPPLLAQLAVGGQLVIPVGPIHSSQVLQQITRTASGYETRRLDPVSFVPLRLGMA